MVFLTAIEMSHNQEKWNSNSKLAVKSCRVLKRLSCSINYDFTGGGSSCSRVRIRNLEAGVICLQETKLENMSYNVVRSLWGCSRVDWCCLDFAGGLVVFCLCGIGGWWRKLMGAWVNS